MNAELEILIRLFVEAAGLVEKELLRALSRDAKATARMKRERLTVISAILARLRSDAIGTKKDPGAAWDLIRAGYGEGSEAARNDLVTLGAKPGPVSRDLGGIHLDAVRVLYESLTDSLDAAITHVGRKANDALRKATLHEVLVAHLAGRDRRGTATALEENLKSRGIEGFEDSKGRGWTLERYSRMAAATTAHEASTTAALNRYAENGIDLVRWVARPESGRDHPCDECKKLDGKVYSITGTTPGYPVLETAPPLHPYCLVPGQSVAAPNLLASSKRWYEGEVVVVRTANGDDLTCTPNHPVLTSRGWVAASELVKGGDVIRSLSGERTFESVAPDDDYVPALIEDVADSVGVAGAVPPRRVPVAPEHFHGDGVGSEVAVIRSDGLLGNGLDAVPVDQPLCEHEFRLVGVGGAAFLSGGHLDPLLDGLPLSSERVVGGGGHGPSLLDGGARIPGADLLGLPATGDAHVVETSVDDVAADTIPLGEGEDTLPAFVAPSEIVEVERDSFHGFVYNLQTEQGWYICNSIITHNCVCVVTAYIEGLS